MENVAPRNAELLENLAANLVHALQEEMNRMACAYADRLQAMEREFQNRLEQEVQAIEGFVAEPRKIGFL